MCSVWAVETERAAIAERAAVAEHAAVTERAARGGGMEGGGGRLAAQVHLSAQIVRGQGSRPLTQRVAAAAVTTATATATAAGPTASSANRIAEHTSYGRIRIVVFLLELAEGFWGEKKLPPPPPPPRLVSAAVMARSHRHAVAVQLNGRLPARTPRAAVRCQP